MNVFEAVKQSVTTRQAAEHFGIRVGRNGMCVCPFHADKNPSMKVDRRFHCFGCQADGDVIDFVSRLEAVSPKEAALILAQAFSIPYEDKEPSSHRKPPQETPEQRFRRMERYCFRVLCDYRNLLRRWKRDYMDICIAAQGVDDQPVVQWLPTSKTQGWLLRFWGKQQFVLLPYGFQHGFGIDMDLHDDVLLILFL